MSERGNWKRVTKRRPCPVCGRPDWCLYAGPDDAPTAAICPRVESDRRAGEAGFLHKLRDDGGPVWSPRARTIRLAAAGHIEHADQWDQRAERCRADLSPLALARLADGLGLSPAPLRRLTVGWWREQGGAFTFPMRSAAGAVLGIRLRRPDGSKLAIRGGREGLFIPAGLVAPQARLERLLVCEGPTDTAALLDLGFSAVGRPNCTGGVKLLAALVAQLRPDEVVIVADPDPPGQRGAAALAVALLPYAPAVRTITPPAGIKDARAWLQAGATPADVLATIEASPVRKLTIASKGSGARHGQG